MPRNAFRYNDRHYTLDHAYAFLMATPDFEHSPDPMHPKMIDAPAIALSDQPFDEPALQGAGRGVLEALDRMAAKAAVLMVMVGPGDSVAGLSLKLPGWDMSQQGDLSSSQTLSLDRSKPGRLAGHLVIKGDPHMHEFDPQHIPLVEGDISFDAAAPKPLPPLGK
ncbi:MAG: hypothetical protein P4L83_03500 [Nevskia sp.]|nr:hypothetical protein [Nevskia sp.]